MKISLEDIAGFESECLVLGVPRGNEVILLKPDEEVEAGVKVF